MKTTTLFLTLLLGASAAQASDYAWLPEPDMTPTSLSSAGAALTGTDSILWPDGKSVLLTYWLGENDVTFRCAELRDGDAANPSCWRREDVLAPAARSGQVARSISTRRRPAVQDYCEPYFSRPNIWVGVGR